MWAGGGDDRERTRNHRTLRGEWQRYEHQGQRTTFDPKLNTIFSPRKYLYALHDAFAPNVTISGCNVSDNAEIGVDWGWCQHSTMTSPKQSLLHIENTNVAGKTPGSAVIR